MGIRPPDLALLPALLAIEEEIWGTGTCLAFPSRLRGAERC